jgi:hypothetical protein
MWENTLLNNSLELCQQLSEAEQESLSAGQNINSLDGVNLSAQQTNIDSTAENTLSLKGGDTSIQKTTYSFSQTTLGFSLKFGSPNSSDGNMWNIFLLDLLSRLLA